MTNHDSLAVMFSCSNKHTDCVEASTALDSFFRANGLKLGCAPIALNAPEVDVKGWLHYPHLFNQSLNYCFLQEIETADEKVTNASFCNSKITRSTLLDEGLNKVIKSYIIIKLENMYPISWGMSKVDDCAPKIKDLITIKLMKSKSIVRGFVTN